MTKVLRARACVSASWQLHLMLLQPPDTFALRSHLYGNCRQHSEQMWKAAERHRMQQECSVLKCCIAATVRRLKWAEAATARSRHPLACAASNSTPPVRPAVSVAALGRTEILIGSGNDVARGSTLARLRLSQSAIETCGGSIFGLVYFYGCHVGAVLVSGGRLGRAITTLK